MGSRGRIMAGRAAAAKRGRETIDPGAAQLRAKLLRDFSPECRDVEVVRHELIPLFEDYDAWMVGGFIADSGKATDVDVFVLDPDYYPFTARMKEWKLERAYEDSYRSIANIIDRWIGRLPTGMPLDVVGVRAHDIKDVVSQFDHEALCHAYSVATGVRRNIWVKGRPDDPREAPLRKMLRRLKNVERYGLGRGKADGFRNFMGKALAEWERLQHDPWGQGVQMRDESGKVPWWETFLTEQEWEAWARLNRKK